MAPSSPYDCGALSMSSGCGVDMNACSAARAHPREGTAAATAADPCARARTDGRAVRKTAALSSFCSGDALRWCAGGGGRVCWRDGDSARAPPPCSRCSCCGRLSDASAGVAAVAAAAASACS
eukprot:355552-Chlamydomonas_euryale.AAC.3